MTDGPAPAGSPDPNPYAPPAADPAPVTLRPILWRGALAFALRAVLMLVVLPGLFTALLALLGSRWWWALPPLAWALMGPVVALQAVDRFLAPVRDPTPVVFATGLVMDRWRFRRLARVVLVERLFLSILLVAVAVPIAGTFAALLVPFLVLFAAWTVWFAFQNVRISDSLVALVEEDYAAVAERAGAVLARPILNRALLSVAALHVGVARLRLGDPDAAIAALEKVPRWSMPQAHFTRAWLLAGRGRVDDARRALEGRGAHNLGERMAHEYARAAIALEEGHPEAVVAMARGWTDLREGQPKSLRAGFDLVEAGALALAGRRDEARNVLGRTGAVPEDRAWFEQTWPRLWAALVDLREAERP